MARSFRPGDPAVRLLPEARPGGGRQKPMKPPGEVCNDGSAASLAVEEAGFAVTELGAEA
jgi:hypothetical protein